MYIFKDIIPSFHFICKDANDSKSLSNSVLCVSEREQADRCPSRLRNTYTGLPIQRGTDKSHIGNSSVTGEWGPLPACYPGS